MDEAITLYNEFIDIDYMDYTETIEADLSYISELVREFGFAGAREYLRGMME